MSKLVNFKSSLARKYWMALTGLFLITFLIGHLLGNLQLIMHDGEEGRRAFNEYAYFMGHNIFIKILAYATYFSILFHAFFGLYLAVLNKKARPVGYAYNNPGANSTTASRYMAVLGTIILVFICTHMANFWWKQKVVETVPLHVMKKSSEVPIGQNPMTGEVMKSKITVSYYLTTNGQYLETNAFDETQKKYIDFNKQQYSDQEVNKLVVKNVDKLYDKATGIQVGQGYKDLHTAVMTFFGQTTQGVEANQYALWAVIGYVLSMIVLAFHLWHGFGSAFQSLGLNHRMYNGLINFVGKAFAIIVPTLFAIIPIIIFLKK